MNKPKTQTRRLLKPVGSVLRRDPTLASESCRLEGWKHNLMAIRTIFTKGDAVRVVMEDGRSGTVEWDMTPNTELRHGGENQ